jgi:hypothetical protein
MIAPAGIGFGLAAGLVLLSACDDFNRFQQEKYECNWNPAGILEIELRSMKVDTKASLVTIDGDQTGKLVFSNDRELIIEAPDLIIRIDREKSLIRATIGTRYHELRCKKIEFKM